jgi:hypothetical protein
MIPGSRNSYSGRGRLAAGKVEFCAVKVARRLEVYCLIEQLILNFAFGGLRYEEIFVILGGLRVGRVI